LPTKLNAREPAKRIEERERLPQSDIRRTEKIEAVLGGKALRFEDVGGIIVFL